MEVRVENLWKAYGGETVLREVSFVLRPGVTCVMAPSGTGKTTLLRILLGIAGGSAIAIGNFAVMCLTVQTAVDITDQKKMKAFFQASYNGRLLLQAGWVIVSILVPGIHIVAGAAPLLFPHVIILYLSAKGKLVTPSDRKNPPAEETEEPEDRLESFEI